MHIHINSCAATVHGNNMQDGDGGAFRTSENSKSLEKFTFF